MGQPQKLVDSDGTIIWDRIATPFGETYAQMAGAETDDPQRFPGQRFDQLTGLSYNHFRDYDPTLGRYIQSDPIGLAGGINTYAYVGGNPVNRVDPDGLCGNGTDGSDCWETGENNGQNANEVDAAFWAAIAACSPIDEAVILGAALAKGGQWAVKNILGKLAGEAVKKGGKGLANPKVKAAVEKGKKAHKEFADKVDQKPGWQSEKTITGPNGEKLRPDALTPKGRPVELKPNTPSGRRQGIKQIKKYKDATGTNGRVVYYDP